MKYIYSYSISVLFIIAVYSANAQVFVGGEVQTPNNVQQGYTGASTKPDRIKFVNFAYFMPDLAPAFPYANGPFKEGSSADFGVMFESGSFRFFGPNFIADAGNIGLYSSFGFGTVFYDFNLPDDFSGMKLPFAFVDLKLGPNIYFEFGETSSVNIYGNIGALASYGGMVISEYTDYLYTPKGLPLGLQTGVGLSLVLGNFIIGGQYTMAINDYTYDIDTPDNYEEEMDYLDVSLNSLRAYIGFRLKR